MEWYQIEKYFFLSIDTAMVTLLTVDLLSTYMLAGPSNCMPNIRSRPRLQFFTYNVTTDDFRAEWWSFYGVIELAVPADENTVNENGYPRLQAPSQLFASAICVKKTCGLELRSQKIWHVRRKLIISIWVMLLSVPAFVEVSTVT